MKIAFFNYLPIEYGGGLAKFYTEISAELKKRHPQIEINLVTFNENIAKKILSFYCLYFFRDVSKDYKKQSTQQIRKRLSNVKYIKAKSVNDLKNIFSKHDIVYCKNDLIEAVILKVLIGKKYLETVIFGFHTPIKYYNTKLFHSKLHNFFYQSYIYKYILSIGDKYHVLSQHDKSMAQKMFPKKNIVKINNPFDFDGYVIKAKKFTYPLKSSNKFKIIWVGRLTKEKGIDDLIKLINSINIKIKNKIVWNIIGEGEFRKNIVESKSKWNNINYFGYIDNNLLASIYKRCDLYICTSKFETFPYTFLEAQSLGLPIISYNIPGCNEIVEHGINGFLVKNFTEFHDKLLSYIQKPTLSNVTISKYIRKKYDREKIYKDMQSLFIQNQ